MCSTWRTKSSINGVFKAMPSQNEPNQANQQLARLVECYGELMDSDALMRLFGCPSERALRRAAMRGALPIKVFRVPGRPGWFARTQTVAAWLATVEQDDPNRPQETPMS